MSRSPLLSAALASLLALTGCVTTAPTPPAVVTAPPATGPAATPVPAAPAAEPAPTRTPPPAPAAAPAPAPAPVAVIELPPASIQGSEETSTLLDNFTAYVAEVDGVPVTAGRDGWNKPVMLKAGPRRLTLAFARGVFNARALVEFHATSRTAYQVKFATDAEFLGKNSYCEFWIVDTASGADACAKVRVPLTRVGAH